jgi:hypothetical protein
MACKVFHPDEQVRSDGLLPSLFPLPGHGPFEMSIPSPSIPFFGYYSYSDSSSESESEEEVREEEEEEDAVYCAMCGERGADQHYVRHTCIPNRVTYFCKDKECFDLYRYCAYEFYDLTHGIPHLWKVIVEEERRRKVYRHAYHKLRKHQHSSDDECDCSPYKCAYCGHSGENVILNICMPRRFSHTTFCRNNVCCKNYVAFVENKMFVPVVFRE